MSGASVDGVSLRSAHALAFLLTLRCPKTLAPATQGGRGHAFDSLAFSGRLEDNVKNHYPGL
jgi:hypothetical protein